MTGQPAWATGGQPAAPPAPDRVGRGEPIRGTVVALSEKNDPRVNNQGQQITGTVLRFRIERGLGSQVPVEMRGRTFHGSLQAGDRVEVLGPWRRGQTLKPQWVLNLDTHERIEAAGWWSWWHVAAVVVFLAVMICIFAFGAMFVSDRWDDLDASWNQSNSEFESFKATMEAGSGFQTGEGLAFCLQGAFSQEARDWCHQMFPDS
jgi:hypothetical protein